MAQLEIVAFAQAVLALLTYMAYWDKPQNVDEPTTIFLPKFSDDPAREARVKDYLRKGANDHSIGDALDVFIDCRNDRTVDSARVLDYKVGCDGQPVYRRRYVRLVSSGRFSTWSLADGQGHFRSIMPSAVSVTFGGLHCLAWDFTFPSEVE